MEYTLTAGRVQSYAARVLTDCLGLVDYGTRCPVSTLLAVVFTACARMCSLFAAGRHLRQAPSHETIRKALQSNLHDLEGLQDRLNTALIAYANRSLRRHPQKVAVDLHLKPYHGQPQLEENELVRGQAKSGTTHFHAYATAYLVLHGQRLTLALVYVRQGESSAETLRRLMRLCTQAQIKTKLVLLDRGFWTVAVIRYLQAARRPFVMPIITRGRKEDHLKGPSGTRVFQTYTKGAFSRYTLTESKTKQTATVGVGVYLRYKMGRRGEHGRQRLPYAYWGWNPRSVHAVHEQYRKRFGIESSYRQGNEARIKTCTRSPLVRLFLIAVALLMRNLWVWLHHEVLSSPRRGRRRYNLNRLTFKSVLLLLQHHAEALLGIDDDVFTDRLVPQ